MKKSNVILYLLIAVVFVAYAIIIFTKGNQQAAANRVENREQLNVHSFNKMLVYGTGNITISQNKECGVWTYFQNKKDAELMKINLKSDALIIDLSLVDKPDNVQLWIELPQLDSLQLDQTKNIKLVKIQQDSMTVILNESRLTLEKVECKYLNLQSASSFVSSINSHFGVMQGGFKKQSRFYSSHPIDSISVAVDNTSNLNKRCFLQ